MDTTRMRAESGFEPADHHEAFDDLSGPGLTPIVDPEWHVCRRTRATLAQRWVEY